MMAELAGERTAVAPLGAQLQAHARHPAGRVEMLPV